MSKKNTATSSKKIVKPSRPVKQTEASQPEMKTAEIRDLIDFISKTGLNEVNIETKELKLHVKREPDQKVFKSSGVTSLAIPQESHPQQLSTYAPPQPAKVEKTEPVAAAGKKTVEIKSPMIGTFYRSATPDSPLFVNVGDKVTKGQTVCIIEAMKLFNEIESEHSGTIVKALIENSSPVEYDQALFIVEPD